MIREDLELLREMEGNSFDELAQDAVTWNAVQHLLQKVIGRGIDINQHLILELADPEYRTPRDYHETFLLLAELDVLPEDFAEEIAKSAGFRNRLVHEYNHLDEETVYDTIGDAIKQYTRYCGFVLKFLER